MPGVLGVSLPLSESACDKLLFESLLSVAGVGPRAAVTLLLWPPANAATDMALVGAGGAAAPITPPPCIGALLPG